MSTPFGSPGADPAGSQPTQPFWVGADPHAANPTWGEQAGGAGPQSAASQAGSFEDHLKKGRRKALHWTLALVAAALVGGGTITGLSLTGHSSPGSGQGRPGRSDARQAALLNSALNNAGSPGSLNAALNATEMSTGAKPGGARAGAAVRGTAAQRCAKARWVARQAGRAGLPRLARRLQLGATHCRLFHHRVFMFFLLHGVDGQFTIQARQGDRTLAYERGVIQSVNAGKSFVVRATDGTTWTWDLVSTTVVRDQQGKVAESTLTTGTPVWVGGPVAAGAKDARLVILRPPVPASVSPSPTPSS